MARYLVLGPFDLTGARDRVAIVGPGNRVYSISLVAVSVNAIAQLHLGSGTDKQPIPLAVIAEGLDIPAGEAEGIYLTNAAQAGLSVTIYASLEPGGIAQG